MFLSAVPVVFSESEPLIIPVKCAEDVIIYSVSLLALLGGRSSSLPDSFGISFNFFWWLMLLDSFSFENVFT